ncbi:putative amidoligase domain-containing protein [Cohnella lupini]|uniref:PhiEco32-like amidoligase-type 2 protein n=1 Tax=Cohnella lupini TaxID=1294267 RepID=A0A3D9IF64_9BACL|nr:hypothetical protein [Cohnella lupini]RED60325.1 phiEco32-like amidoligase-type 2 protein [Cohnella lupini]
MENRLEGKARLLVKPGDRLGVWGRGDLSVTTEFSDIGPNDCVIPIGKPEGLPKAIPLGNPIKQENISRSPLRLTPWIMNESASRILALPEIEIERRLRREGLPARIGTAGKDIITRSSLSSTDTFVSVTVWGFDAIEIRRVNSFDQRVNGVKYSSEGISGSYVYSSEHALWKPAARISARALYLLGLDFGQVELALSEAGKFTVTGISPLMKLSGRAAKQRLSDAVSRFSKDWAHETKNGVQAKLGADPEFVLLSKEGRIVPATRYFSPDGAAGCDSVRVKGEKRWPLVEIRPRPSVDPEKVLSEMHRLLCLAAERTAGASLTWRAGALPVPGLPLGGHIHMSGVAMTGERLRALDNAVGLTLRLLEPPLAARRRPRYGTLGDVRRQPHGGFEYRTPPSWLVSPSLALGVIALAKVAAEHSRELASNRPLDDDRIRDAFYAGDRILLMKAADSFFESIRGTSGYVEYKEPIDFLFRAVARERSWDESADIRLKWRIPLG